MNAILAQHESDARRDALSAALAPRHMLATGKSGPAFEDRPLATDLARSMQAQGLAAAGDVFYACERKCITDLTAAWTRLLSTVGVSVTPIPLHLGPWARERQSPWERIAATVVQAMCHADLPTAGLKWTNADAIIRAWAKSHRDGLAKELYGHEQPSDRDLIEDGASDPERIKFLRGQVDTLTVFVAGVR